MIFLRISCKRVLSVHDSRLGYIDADTQSEDKRSVRWKETSAVSCWEKTVTEALGGEVAALIDRLRGRRFHCIGRCSEHIETIGSWYGYIGHGGLLDAKGNSWWVYQKCSDSKYNIAWWKVDRLLVLPNQIVDSSKQTVFNEEGGLGFKRCADHKTQKNDYYKILKIGRSSSQEEIKRAYIHLVKRFHPDLTQTDSTTASEIMRAINEAYEILSDPYRRSEYDSINRRTSFSSAEKT